MQFSHNFFRAVAVGFQELPELDMISEAAKGLIDVEYVDRPAALSRWLSGSRSVLLLLPSADSKGVSMAGLAVRWKTQLPDLMTVVILTQKSGAGRAISSAARAGLPLVSISSHTELRQLFKEALGHSAVTPEEQARIEAAVAPLPSELGRTILTDAAMFAHEHLTRELLAARLGISLVTLVRRCGAAALPAPSELITWGQLLRVSVSSGRELTSPFALARAAGFSDVAELRRSIESLLKLPGVGGAELTPAQVMQALGSRLPAPARAIPIESPIRSRRRPRTTRKPRK
jgi:hypothetical protein